MDAKERAIRKSERKRCLEAIRRKRVSIKNLYRRGQSKRITSADWYDLGLNAAMCEIADLGKTETKESP